MTFKSLFEQFTILSVSFVISRVSRFPVSHLTYETVKLGLQNTLKMSKTTRVYFGVLHDEWACEPIFQTLSVLIDNFPFKFYPNYHNNIYCNFLCIIRFYSFSSVEVFNFKLHENLSTKTQKKKVFLVYQFLA